MSKITICEGDILWTSKKDTILHSFGGDMVFNAGHKNIWHGEQGIEIGKYRDMEYLKDFSSGWWSSDSEGKEKINEALIGEIVYFHLETRNIPNGEKVGMTLWDDDVKRAEEEKDDTQGSDKIKLYPIGTTDHSKDNESKYGVVHNNKVVREILLNDYFAKLIKEEDDKAIELFFACSYNGQNIELPLSFGDYLKVKGLPKIIFVNGQWNLAKSLPFNLGKYFGPIQPLKPYWAEGIWVSAQKYFNLKVKHIKNNSELSFEELEKKNYILYYDGSSKAGFDQSGADRFANGRKFAEENFEETTNGLAGNEIYLVSHSEGGAYAAGMADYLHEKGIKIGEHILLSPDEGDEFSINPEIPSYQLTYMFFSSIFNPILAIPKAIKFKIWGNYYAIVDWVTNEHRVKGTQKMGIVHYQESGWDGVHGWTNGNNVFTKVSDLKEVRYFLVQGERDGEFYAGYDQTKTTNGTKFYRIDDEYIITNCPPLIEI